MVDSRAPFIETFVKEVDENTKFLSVTGMVIDRKENSFVLDDGTGKIIVLAENITDMGNFIRIFGTCFRSSEGFQIHAEIIQDLSKLDTQLYRKVMELLKKQ
jgi:tRNA G18 (ribose-2'-O)-methylase SpoU